MKRTTAVLALAAAAAAPLTFVALPARADNTILAQPAPSGVLSLSAQASAEVPQDVVEITLFYEQQAGDASSLTNTLNQHADAALKQAKGVAGVKVHTGTFSIYPTTDRDGRISAWRGRAEIVLESRDFGAASRLAGQLNSTMQVGSVAYSLSPEAQRAASEKLTTDAIGNFQAQAKSSANAFGYSGYTIREVDVGRNAPPPPRPMFAMRAMAAEAKAAAPLPVEAGTSTVSVNVSGSVQMTR